MRELWAIRHKKTLERVSHSTYFTEEQAETAIQQWIERYHRGGRKDLSLEWLQALEAYRL